MFISLFLFFVNPYFSFFFNVLESKTEYFLMNVFFVMMAIIFLYYFSCCHTVLSVALRVRNKD